MTDNRYTRDTVPSCLNATRQCCTWPPQCAICSGSTDSIKMYFAPTIDSDSQYICAMQVDPPTSLNDDVELDGVPIVFTVIGQISREDCFLTATGEPLEGRISRDHVHDRPVASCWFESGPDRDACREWRKLLSAIEHITASAVGPINTSRVIRLVPDESAVQLRVRFSPDEGEIADRLPFFETEASRNVHRVPASLEEVPFDQPFRVAFLLEYVYEGRERFLFADLVAITNI